MEQPKDIKEKLPQIDKFKGDMTMWVEWHLGAQHKLLKDGEALGSPFHCDGW
ncbi:Bgt-50091 [Blumeria graminis f. sp. tritici]|uniref:Bgt-50091 n=1 Tax=Blumeria graminis f. sp. tritici TaxID=62690 RepID=A0A9X9L7U3_BLUGR|nr:Bgt-50091 [Blumeria graminis f. sp. tritici]